MTRGGASQVAGTLRVPSPVRGAMSSGRQRARHAERACYRAFVLVELMFVLGLLAVVALVATQIFVFNMRTSARLSRQHESQAQFDQAAEQLRRDVWSASSLESQGAQVLKVKLADGQEVTWHGGKELDRTLSSQIRHWNALDADISFDVHGPTVTIAIEPHQSDAAGKLTLVSQAMLLQGGRQ